MEFYNLEKQEISAELRHGILKVTFYDENQEKERETSFPVSKWTSFTESDFEKYPELSPLYKYKNEVGKFIDECLRFQQSIELSGIEKKNKYNWIVKFIVGVNNRKSEINVEVKSCLNDCIDELCIISLDKIIEKAYYEAEEKLEKEYEFLNSLLSINMEKEGLEIRCGRYIIFHSYNEWVSMNKTRYGYSVGQYIPLIKEIALRLIDHITSPSKLSPVLFSDNNEIGKISSFVDTKEYKDFLKANNFDKSLGEAEEENKKLKEKATLISEDIECEKNVESTIKVQENKFPVIPVDELDKIKGKDYKINKIKEICGVTLEEAKIIYESKIPVNEFVNEKINTDKKVQFKEIMNAVKIKIYGEKPLEKLTKENTDLSEELDSKLTYPVDESVEPIDNDKKLTLQDIIAIQESNEEKLYENYNIDKEVKRLKERLKGIENLIVFGRVSPDDAKRLYDSDPELAKETNEEIIYDRLNKLNVSHPAESQD